MTECAEDQIEFSILGLVRDPILDFIKELAVNVKCLQVVDAGLREERSNGDIEDTVGLANGVREYLTGPDPTLELTQQDIDNAEIPSHRMDEYQNGSNPRLLSLRNELVASQMMIKKSIQNELQSRRLDENYAAGRRHDYNPAIIYWARALAKKGLLPDLASKATTKTWYIFDHIILKKKRFLKKERRFEGKDSTQEWGFKLSYVVLGPLLITSYC